MHTWEEILENFFCEKWRCFKKQKVQYLNRKAKSTEPIFWHRALSVLNAPFDSITARSALSAALQSLSLSGIFSLSATTVRFFIHLPALLFEHSDFHWWGLWTVRNMAKLLCLFGSSVVDFEGLLFNYRRFSLAKSDNHHSREGWIHSSIDHRSRVCRKDLEFFS